VGGGALLLRFPLDVGSKTIGARLTGTTGTIPTATVMRMIFAVVAPCCAFVRAAFVAAILPRTPS